MKARNMGLALVLVFSGALALHAGGQQEGNEILLWWESASSGHQQDMQELVVDRFNEENDEYQVSIEFREDLEQQLRVSLLSGTGPDIALSAGPSYVANLVENDQLLPLDDYAEQYGWTERFVPSMLELGTFDDELYALPKTYETLVLFYNETLFEEEGWDPPETIDDIEELAPQMMEQGIVPLSGGNSDWQGANEWYVTVFLNHYAGPEKVYQALTGEIPWTDQAFVESIELLKDWWDRGWFGEDYFSLTTEQEFAQLASRDAAMSMIGTWAFQYIDNYFGDSDDEVNFVPIPQLSEDAPYPSYTLGVGTTYSISADSNVQDGAAALINHLVSDDFIVDINEVWPGEWVVPVTTVPQDELAEVTTDLFARHTTELNEAVASGNYGYTTWSFWPPETMTYIIEGIEQVWFDDITVEEYLEEVDDIFQDELEAGAVPPIPSR